ncbi:MAG TPA: hypothetical protein VF283_11745, partial [Bryobacteraceae bacterium]
MAAGRSHKIRTRLQSALGNVKMRKVTAKRILVSLLAALPLFATPPVVSNISFLYGSHSSVSVQFDISATGNDFRMRYIPA